MGTTTDRDNPCLKVIEESGQQACYLVLSDEERQRGFVRPVRTAYRHIACGGDTRMGEAIAETYAVNPKFYTCTYCCRCFAHFPLIKDGERQFEWLVNGKPDGSFVGE